MDKTINMNKLHRASYVRVCVCVKGEGTAIVNKRTGVQESTLVSHSNSQCWHMLSRRCGE